MNNATERNTPIIFRGGLSEDEWQELVSLEYVLTWRYSKDEEQDEKRHKELRDKCYSHPEHHSNLKTA